MARGKPIDYWQLSKLIVSFVIDTNPLPKQRPRVVKRKGASFAYTPRETARYEKYVAKLAREAMGEREPTKELVALDLVFYRARRNADLDNICKATMDPIQGIIYKNDNQVVDLRAQWRRDKEWPHAEVAVWSVKGEK